MVQKLNYQGIEFSVATKHYDKIDEQNSININVFGYGNKQFYPMYVSKQHNKVVLNLLLITEGEKQHYVLVKDFDRMMYNKTKYQHRKYFCIHCLQCFSTKEIVNKHMTNCMVINGEQAIRDGSLFMGMTGSGKNRTGFENFFCRGDRLCVFFLNKETGQST